MTRRAVVLVLVFVALAGCSRQPVDPAQRPVAYVGQQPLTLQELEAYLADNILNDLEGQGSTNEELDEIKSRLLDALIEERMLVAEAERRGVTVSDDEVALYLGVGAMEYGRAEESDQSADESGAGTDSDDAPGAVGKDEVSEAVRRLTIHKLHESALGELEPIEASDVDVYVEAHRERLQPPRQLELRALMLDSMQSAKKVYEDIRRRRITFDEAVVLYEEVPGRSLPQRVSWDGLSDEVRQAVEGLKAGRISRPVDLHDTAYLFLVASWLEDREQSASELRDRAHRELEAARRTEAYARLVADAGRHAPSRLNTRNLPFRYVPPMEHDN